MEVNLKAASWRFFVAITMGRLIVMAIPQQTDKEALNVRNLPNHANHPNRRNLHGQDVTTSA
nr:MAG TPA: hypothetical protein [Caudoviricetes sp.]